MTINNSELSDSDIQAILEAALLIADEPLSIKKLRNLFPDQQHLTSAQIKANLTSLSTRYLATHHGIVLAEVASGYRIQTKPALLPWLTNVAIEKAPRYSRALFETLVIIAYKQPVTRAEIEAVRGVAVSSTILKTLQERDWVRILGYRELPGKPAAYGTTAAFLDYFNLKELTDLPPLPQSEESQFLQANDSAQFTPAIDHLAVTADELS